MTSNGASRLLPFLEPLSDDASIHDYRFVHPPMVDTVEINAIYFCRHIFKRTDSMRDLSFRASFDVLCYRYNIIR